MSRRHTRVLAADPSGIASAAAILRSGGLVAFPTETVYGLGAHALDAHAVRRIFEAKGRPADDPLILHIAAVSDLTSLAHTTPQAQRLAESFWPGPLTLVLPKRDVVPPEVSAGLATVGVRVPSHPIAQHLLRATGLPVAAPSANLFGRPSPTRASHVLDDLNGRIDAVLDGGQTSVGVESTIVDLSTTPPRLLRPGAIPSEAIEAALGAHLVAPARVNGPQPAPGLLDVHYAPRTPLTLIRGDRAGKRLVSEVERALERGQRVGVLALDEDLGFLPSSVSVEVVGAWSAPSLSAARLFNAMRSLDNEHLDILFTRELADPDVGLGRALADRLRRASQRVIDTEP